MSLLISLQAVSKSFGNRSLFQEISLSLFENDRVGLIGPNGSGKSTLLKIIAGDENADSGIISPRRGLKVGYVPQECHFDDLPPREILINTLDPKLPDYEREQIAEMWLSKLGFKGDEPHASLLSGGWKKRLRIAQELITGPDVLLLDEPTNHLDLEGILWLEKFLLREAPAYLLVSHDRYFLQQATSRIIEINPVYPKGIFAIDGSYSHFLEKKHLFIEGQLEQERSFASKARREVDWLKRSPKARTTKSQARIDSAEELLDDLSAIQLRNQVKRTKIDFAATERETRKLLAAKNLCMQAGGKTLFKHIEFTLSPQTRLGLMGPNGCGKTTLLRLLAAELTPDQGTLKKADGIHIVYFDQHRMQLPDNITLREALSPQGDYVTFRGQKIHVNGWCKRFLFSPDILDLPINKLSGGERARISIAHLMLQPADILLLDEPTNDLDIPTLETLEESLLEFPGAVVLITHDRCMLDRVCNTVLALGSPDSAELYPDYHQWEEAQKRKEKPQPAPSEPVPEKPKPTHSKKKEQAQIEAKIVKREAEVKRLTALLEKDEVALNPEKLQQVCSEIAIIENEIEQLYIQWGL